MFLNFFYELKNAKLPVSLNEYLTLMGALDRDLALKQTENFYFLSRASLIKDERHFDKFDRVFSEVFKGLDSETTIPIESLPEDWLQRLTEKFLTDEEKAEIEALGGWDKIMETLKKRLEEQEKRHQGGSKWICTAGTSPFGAYGYNPAGIRMGQDENRNNRAIKVWDKRLYKNLDDSVEIGTRNIKIALRRLRKLTREGIEEELDLDNTIRSTAHRGYLDVILQPERRNTIKVLMFFDVGGSMDWHVKTAEELFSAARSEFKNLEYYYFHNCPYEFVWRDNQRRWNEKISTWEVLRTYGSDYKVIFVGDAAMSSYELTVAGGAIEHVNEEPGLLWLQRILDVYDKSVWLCPVPEKYWELTPSIQMIRKLMNKRIYPLTLSGLDCAIKELM
ncbi:MAG: vWA domain-containing protein [Methyloligellaceae bacterium]